MARTGLLLKTAFILSINNPVLFCQSSPVAGISSEFSQDTSMSNQILCNGRSWRNLYLRVVGGQFLYTQDYIPGTVFIGTNTFNNVPVRYDIFNDELISHNTKGLLIQLNKENIDSFNLYYSDRISKFVNLGESGEPSGFVRVLYKGDSRYYVKYRKNIEMLAVEGKYDLFYEIWRLYLVKDGVAHLFNGRLELFRLFGEYRREVRSYMRKNNIIVMRDYPESFTPLIEYYDKLKK